MTPEGEYATLNPVNHHNVLFFLSSTYNDLVKDRKAAHETIHPLDRGTVVARKLAMPRLAGQLNNDRFANYKESVIEL